MPASKAMTRRRNHPRTHSPSPYRGMACPPGNVPYYPPPVIDPLTQAFKNALSGWGGNPVMDEPIPDIPESQRGSRLEPKCIDMRYDSLSQQFLSSERESPQPVPSWTGPVPSDPYAEFAFTLHRTLSPVSQYKAYFDIRSQHLRRIFEETIGQVEGVSWTAKPLRVDYQIFIIFRKELQVTLSRLEATKDAGKSEESVAREHLAFFRTFLDTEYAGIISELTSLIEHGEITFDFLWAVLKPRSLLYTRCSHTSEPRALRLLEANKINEMSGFPPAWQLNVEYVDYNWQYDGYASGNKATDATRGPTPKLGLVAGPHSQSVDYFKGTRKITSLGIYPLEYYPQLEELKSLLVTRGRKWASLQGGIHHLQYNMPSSALDRELKLLSTERIVIDREKYGTTGSGNNPTLLQVTKALDGKLLDNTINIWPTLADDYSDCGDTPVSKGHAKEDEETELKEDDLMITNPCLYGYNFNVKRWVAVGVDSVGPVEWNDEPFDNLVLGGNQKVLVKALVEAHYATDATTGRGSYARFDDFVQGKGQGLVINLFGNPGVGKTLTAEATSEHVRKPLMILGAADLGTSASSVERELSWAFQHAARWGAIVLIDEADVFLEARSLHDLERNALVAVFLRQLEYFRGILFLTTNRVRSIDPAFQSRIHVSLRYRDLSVDARRSIWVAFLTKARGTFTGAALKDFGHGLAERELKMLSERSVNGRQIKNAVRTASALASSMQEMLGYKYLESVLEMMAEFEAEMNAARDENA